ncbi:hypothetical protein ACWENA_06905 [Streptomyces sp. NPDC004779]
MSRTKRLVVLAVIATALSLGAAVPASANMHITGTTAYDTLRAG